MRTKKGLTRRAPQRLCIVCREKHPKQTLLRLVRTEEGIVVDPTGKRNGRGAYVCRRRACWDGLQNKRLLASHLAATVSDADLAALAAYRPQPAAADSPSTAAVE